MHGREEGFICDIDGTIALHVNSDGSLRRGHFEYGKVLEDLPNTHVIVAVRAMSYHLQPVFVSGRMDEKSVRADTVRWNTNNLDPFGTYANLMSYPLFMRAEGDYRPDGVIKEEIYWKLIEPRWRIHFAIDDRPRVCRMWRRIGIPTLQVGDPDVDF
jgi:hypothetical protein